MTLIEAAKQAREALEWNLPVIEDWGGKDNLNLQHKAITALNQAMTHEKTFAAISKLKDIEMELHRLKNALEMANRALDAQRTWVGLTDGEIADTVVEMNGNEPTGLFWRDLTRAIEAKLKEKNT